MRVRTHIHRSDTAAGKKGPSRTYALPPIRATDPQTIVRRAALDPAALSRGDLVQLQRTVGNRAVAQLLARAVQRRNASSADVPDAVIREAAREGLQAPAGALPYAEQIRKSFGRHDVSHIKAHQGEAATASAAAMNALAYTTGDHVVLADRPSLHTVAHETAHVVQQRGGVQLAGGIGRADDAYERHAEAVAARVTAGQSAEDLLDHVAGEGAAPAAPVQRLIGFEFETACPLTPGPTESRPQKDEKLVSGTAGWWLVSEVVPGKETRVAEYKTKAIDDQADPAEMAEIMERLEESVLPIAMRPDGVELRRLAPYGTVQDAHKNTTVTRSAPIITGKPQVTGGISVARILDLLAAMGSGNEASRKELIGSVEPKEEGGERTLENLLAKIVRLVKKNLADEPASYQSFIGLLVLYIAPAQLTEVSKYFKQIVPVLSRMNLGSFMQIPVVANRKDRALKDVSAILGLEDLSIPMFKYGVFDPQKNTVVPTPKPTIAEWVTDILNGADKVPWSLNVNQEGKEFGFEETGPETEQKKRWAGVPIELRTLAGGVPFYDWKPLAVHFFRYIGSLNDLSKQPAAFQSMFKGMSERELGVHKEMVAFYHRLLVKD